MALNRGGLEGTSLEGRAGVITAIKIHPGCLPRLRDLPYVFLIL